MELKIKVCTAASCKVMINDETEVGNKGYLPEDSTVTVKDRFKYSDTISIDLLQHNKSDGPKLQIPIYSLHNTEAKQVTLPVGFDGWFTVMHLVIPTKDWFDREHSKETGSALPLYDVVYYSDGTHLYKYVDGESEEATITELVERNPVGSTISKTCENYVSICFLNKCYVSLCQRILNDRGFSECVSKNTVDPDLIFRRDYVWMAINVIKYMVQFEQLAEAERIIEQIGGCNGLCESEFKRMPSRGCGCGK